MRQSFEQLKAEEEELQKECAELERLLRQDALSFENEALEVQLLQIQDDHAQLREELRGTREFYGRRIADMTNQLEERARTTSTAEGHADCLSDLLLFHEDRGEGPRNQHAWKIMSISESSSCAMHYARLRIC